MCKKRGQDFQEVEGLDENANVYKNRARIRMILVEGWFQSNVSKEDLKILVCIKIGPEFQCLEE